jgi:ATP-dependent Clp protease ATP-binding subunit ClpA
MDASNLLKPVLSSNGDASSCMGSTTYPGVSGHLREGPRAGAALPEGRRQVSRPSKTPWADPERAQGALRSSTTTSSTADEALRAGGRAGGALYQRSFHMPDKAIDVIDEAGRLPASAIAGAKAQAKRIEVARGRGHRGENRADSAEIRVGQFGQGVPAQPGARPASMTVFGQDAKRLRFVVCGDQAVPCGPQGAGQADRLLPVRRPDRRGQDRGHQTAGQGIMGIELVRFDMSEYMERHTVSVA